jgi:hypothetical protein
MYIFFSGWLLAVLVATSALYTMLSVSHFLASGQLAGFWQLHIGVSFFVGVGIIIGIADCITLAVGVRFVFRLSILRLCLRMRFFMLVIQL